MHAKGISHRDLTSSNILVTNQFEAKVIHVATQDLACRAVQKRSWFGNLAMSPDLLT